MRTPLVQKRHLAHPRLEHVEAEVARLKDARLGIFACLDVRPEGDRRAGAVGRADDLEVVEDLSALVLLLIDLAVLIDVDLQVLRQRVDDRRAHAVQAAGDLVAAAAELAAGVQHRQADLHRRAADLRMDAHREAAAVVRHGHGAVGVERDEDRVAEAGKRLVDGVVDNFVDEVVQAALVRRADVHSRAAAHRLEPFENLDLAFVVMIIVILIHGISSHRAGRVSMNFSYYYIIPRICTFFHSDLASAQTLTNFSTGVNPRRPRSTENAFFARFRLCF